MRGQLLVAGLVLVLLGADEPKKDPAKEEAAKVEAAKLEVAKLEGTWTVVSQSDENTIPDRWRVRKLIFKENRLTVILKHLNVEYTFTVDPAKGPKHLDRNWVKEGIKGGGALGIYELDGDDLKYCYNNGMLGPQLAGRPTEFKGDINKAATFLLVLKREKP